jgi:hypothetical protein
LQPNGRKHAGTPNKVRNVGNVVEAGNPMVKIKVLILFFLACRPLQALCETFVYVNLNKPGGGIGYQVMSNATREIPIN